MALKITSDEELQELALELGATVDFGDGRVFNAASRQGARRRKAAEPAAPPPAPPPAPAADMAPVLKVLEGQQELVRSLAALAERPAPPAPPPAVVVKETTVVTGWTFQIERAGPMGLAKRITAVPTLGVAPPGKKTQHVFEIERDANGAISVLICK